MDKDIALISEVPLNDANRIIIPQGDFNFLILYKHLNFFFLHAVRMNNLVSTVYRKSNRDLGLFEER